jgi:predicted O-linked N-acetylglucosamine transferase (SPINDLY family)
MLETQAKKIFDQAQKSFEEKNYTNAQKLWLEILDYYPKNLSVLRNLALALYHDGSLENAVVMLKKIIKINKKEPRALVMLILTLEKQDKISESKKYIDFGLRENILDKHWEIKKNLMLPTIFEDLKDVDESRNRLLVYIQEILASKKKLSCDIDSQLIKPLQFNLSYNQYNNLEINKKCVGFFRKIYPQLNKVHQLKSTPSSKIKIGFISDYLTDHTIGKLFKGIILNLDQNKFDTKIFHTTKTKRGEIYQDFIDAEKNNQIKNFILPIKFEDKQKIIARENLDILFYPEIGLSLELYYLSFVRLATYQITSWGHPETTGNDTIDYFLTSKLIESQNSHKKFSEKLLYADFLPMYYYTHIVKNKLDTAMLSKNNIYSCPQTLFKIHPEFDLVLGKILEEDKKAKIYFIKDSDNIYYKKLLNRFKKNIKIDLNRIEFIDGLTWEGYINHCGQASVLLDPFYFSAGNSFYESMFYGTPTITKPTEYTKSRLVVGAYNQMEIEKAPVVNNIDDYVIKSVEIANNKNLYELKNYYKEQAKKNLFENQFIIANLEEIFFKIIN